MAIKAEARPLRTHLPGGGKPGASVSVEPILGGEMQGPKAWFEGTGGRFEMLRAAGLGTPRSRYWWVPAPAFLIRHPSAGEILVDTSLHPSVATRPAANLGPFARFARTRIEPGRDLSSQLRERGVDPRAVATVVMTHLHFDHTSGVSEFPNSTFVIAATEWRAATTDARPALRGYRPAHFDYLFDYRTVDFNGPTISSYASFGRTFDLLGDGSIRLAYTPGHTAGHVSVIARLRDRDFLIAGDAIYTFAQIEGANPPPRPVDMHRWRRSMHEIQQFHRTYPQAVIVPGHDPEHWKGLEEHYD